MFFYLLFIFYRIKVAIKSKLKLNNYQRTYMVSNQINCKTAERVKTLLDSA